jgi:tRNA1Val (adenine37-N6)-methyltransferase
MSIFRFKQFDVDQTGCAMKVNTDGVLLGALAEVRGGGSILDIGTGTGVITLMLAQRFTHIQITAVELDEAAAQTAAANFAGSPFASRIAIQPQSFQNYLEERPDLKFDVIVSNPPFYIHSLKSPGVQMAMAKHADHDFFEQLISRCTAHLNVDGSLWLILPVATSALVKQLAAGHGLQVQQLCSIQSYPHLEPHREIIAFGFEQTQVSERRLTIYNEPKVYSDGYKGILKDFLTIF